MFEGKTRAIPTTLGRLETMTRVGVVWLITNASTSRDVEGWLNGWETIGAPPEGFNSWYRSCGGE
jgi:hypothetical protein